MIGEGSSCVSTDGETIEIGDRCFLMRPRRRQNFVEQHSGGEISPTVSTPEEVKAADGVRPTDNGSETSRVEVIPGSSNEDRVGKGEATTKLPGKGLGENVDDTARVAEGVLMRGLDKARTGVESGSTPPKGVDNCSLTEDTNDESNLIRRDEQAPDSDDREGITNDGNASDYPECNPILRVLIQNMRRAGEAPGLPSICEAGSRAYKIPGATVIIILDAPLMSPTDPWLSPTNDKYSWVSQHASDLIVRLNDVRKDADEHAETRRGSYDIPPQTVEEHRDFEHHDDGDIRSNEQHPAGLGDPKEVLEALFSWLEEGGTPHSGGREVILVCGSDPHGEEKTQYVLKPKGSVYGYSDPAEEMRKGSETGSADSSALEGELHARTQNTVSGSTPSDSEWQEATHQGEVNVVEEDETAPGNGEMDHEAKRNSHEREGCSSSRPTIRQIILGKPLTPNAVQTLTPYGGGDDVLHAPDRFWDRDETITEKESSDDHSLSKKTIYSETRPLSAKGPQQPAPAHPSTVLLEVRHTQTTGEPRVAAIFPPPTIPTVEPTGNVTAVKGSPTRAHEGGRTKGGGKPAQQQQQLPKVIVGPVVGRVGPTTAVILVEVVFVDARAASLGGGGMSDTVGVQLTDTLSGRRHEVVGGRWAGEPGSGPRVFEFETLTPGRRYAIRLMGVRNRDQVNIGRTRAFFPAGSHVKKPMSALRVAGLTRHVRGSCTTSVMTHVSR